MADSEEQPRAAGAPALDYHFVGFAERRSLGTCPPYEDLNSRRQSGRNITLVVNKEVIVDILTILGRKKTR